MLLAIDIIRLELIKIDVPRKLATLGTCEKAKVPLLVKRRDQVRFRTAVRTGQQIILPPKSLLNVPVLTQRAVLKERDFEFVLYENDIKESQAGLGIYRHVVDKEFGFVLVRNDTDHPITLQ